MGVGAGLYIYDVVVKKFTFAISSPDEFLSLLLGHCPRGCLSQSVLQTLTFLTS